MSIRIAALIASASFVLLASTALAGLQEMADRFNRMGRDAMNNKDWVECIEDFEQVIEIDEEHLDAYLDLAYCQSEMKQWEDAADTYDSALEYAPEDRQAEILMNLGYSQASGGDLTGAEKSYRAVAGRTPDDKNAWVAFAHVLRSNKKIDEAIVALQRAIEIDPNDTEILETTGELCTEHGMDELASSIYELWIKAAPGNVAPKRHLGYLLSRMGQCERGQQIFDELLAVDNSNPADLLNAGMLAHRCNDLQKAAKYFSEYRLKNPDDSAIDCRLLYLKEDTGDALGGIQLAKDAGKKFPGDACIQFTFGRLLDLRGNQLQDEKRFDEAISRFQEALGKFQKVLGDAEYSERAQRQIQRLEQLITRAERMKQREDDGFE